MAERLFLEDADPTEAAEPFRTPPGVSRERLRRRVFSELFGQSDDPIQIGRYRVLSRIGQGGMGVVYLAFDIELDRKVAIKLLHDDRGGLHDRLRREAKALARLDHPAIVQVYEVGEHDDFVFLAMEYVRGTTLRQYLKETPRSVAEIVGVFIEVGRALAAAHDAGVVHRDFKPDNVMVVAGEGSARGRVRLLDFGLARSIADAIDAPPIDHEVQASLEALTVTGQVVGTPAYMAPEQFAAKGDVDARADQFAFCVALWEALYGSRPFAAATLPELVAAVEKGRVQEPEQPGRVPRWLRSVLDRGLSVDPQRRYAGMSELVAELGRDRTRAQRRLGALALGTSLAGVALFLVVRQDDELEDALAQQESRAHELEAELQEQNTAGIVKDAWAMLGDDPAETLYALAGIDADDAVWRGEAWALATEALLHGAPRTEWFLPEDHEVHARSSLGPVVWVCDAKARCFVFDVATGESRPVPAEIHGPWKPAGAHGVATDGHGIALWRDSTGVPAQIEFAQPGEPLPFVRLSRELEAVATVTGGSVRAWSMATGEQRIFPFGDLGPATSLPAISDDASTAMLVAHEKLWRVTLDDAPRELASVKLPDRESWQSSRSCLGEGVAMLVERGVVIAELDGSTRWIDKPAGVRLMACAYDSKSRRIVARDDQGAAWATAVGSDGLQPFARHDVADVRLFRDEIVVLESAGALIVGNLTTGGFASLPAASIRSVDLDAEQGWLRGAGVGVLREWSLDLGRQLSGHDGLVTDLLWRETGLVSAGEDGTVREWNAAGGSRVVSKLEHPVVALAPAREGNGVVALDEKRRITKIPLGIDTDFEAPNELLETAVRGQSERDVAQMRVRELMTRRMWSTESAAASLELLRNGLGALAEAPPLECTAFAIDDAGSFACHTRGDVYEIVRFDAAGHTVGARQPSPFEDGPVFAIAASPDGATLAVSGDDGLFVLEAGNWTQPITSTVLDLAFSPSGALLAGAVADGSVFVLRLGGPPVELLSPHTVATSVAFAPDGTRLASAGTEGLVRVYPVFPPTDPEELVEWVRARPKHAHIHRPD